MKIIAEDFDPSINVEGGSIDFSNSAVVDAANRYISNITSKAVVTPYIALEKIRKILSYYKVFLPQTTFLEGDEGNEVFDVSQFGDKFGMTNDGEVKVKNDDGMYVYFEWMMNDEGLFEVFCEIVDEDELDEILKDYASEVEEMNESKDPVSGVYKMIAKTFRGVGRTVKMKKNPDPGRANIDVYGKKAKEHYNKQSGEVQAKINKHLREPGDDDVYTQYKNAVQRAGGKIDES